MPINYNPSQPYRIQTFRSDGWDGGGGDKYPPEYFFEDLGEAIDQGVMLLSTGEWDMVTVEHLESGMYGWGWYRMLEIEQSGKESEKESEKE